MQSSSSETHVLIPYSDLYGMWQELSGYLGMPYIGGSGLNKLERHLARHLNDSDRMGAALIAYTKSNYDVYYTEIARAYLVSPRKLARKVKANEVKRTLSK